MPDLRLDTLESLQDEYFTLPELMGQRAGRHSGNHILEYLKRNKGQPIFRELISALDSEGFKEFKFLGAGHASLVLKATEKQLVRIHRWSLDGENHIHPVVLQPIKTFEVPIKNIPGACIKIEVMPEVITGKQVTREHEEMAKEALEKSGYKCIDVEGYGNVGLIRTKNGLVPVLIDPGLLVKVRDAENHYHLVPDWVSEDGTWAQLEHDPRIMSDKPTGVFDDKRIEKIEATLTGRTWFDKLLNFINPKWGVTRKSNIAEALRETRPYQDDRGSTFSIATREAIKDIERGSEKPFGKLVRERAAQINKGRKL